MVEVFAGIGIVCSLVLVGFLLARTVLYLGDHGREHDAMRRRQHELETKVKENSEFINDWNGKARF